VIYETNRTVKTVGEIMKDYIYASVEFGSHTIKLLISEFVEEKQNILFIDEIPSKGIVAGVIEQKQEVVRDCRKLIERAEDFLDAKIKSVVVMLPSVNLTTKEVSYDLTIPENRVQGKHIKNLFNKVYSEESSDEQSNQEIAFIYPKRFLSSKTRKSIFNPINEITRDLFVTLEVVYEDQKTMIDYVEIIDSCGLEVLDIMPSVVAYKNSLLTKEEMTNYACVVDIGDMTTTITVYHDQLVYKSECFKIGAQNVTKALEETLGLTPKDAIEFKEIHGQAVSKEASQEIVFEQKFSDGSITYITSEYVSKIIDEKYIEILRVIRQYLLETGLKSKINHYYLVGGAVLMMNFETLFKHNFGEHVSIRRPDFIGSRHSKYSAIISGHFNIYYLEKLFEEDYHMIKFNEVEERLD
jgi:cell division protein FtsA